MKCGSSFAALALLAAALWSVSGGKAHHPATLFPFGGPGRAQEGGGLDSPWLAGKLFGDAPGGRDRIISGKRPKRRDPRGEEWVEPEGLKDAFIDNAWATGGFGSFWDGAFDGLASARREKGGGVAFRRRKPAFKTRRRRPTNGAARRKPQRGSRAGEDRASRAPSRTQRAQTRRPQAAGRTQARAVAAGRAPRPDYDGRRGGRGAPSFAVVFGISDGAGPAVGRSGRRKGAAAGKKKESLPKASTLAFWLGDEPIKDPGGDPEAPSFAPFRDLFPESLPDGKSYSRKTPAPELVERIAPPGEMPEYEAWLLKDTRRGRGNEAHWHIAAGNIPFLHAGKAWGRADGGRWTWMTDARRKWWTVADGAQRMLRHDGSWWWRSEGRWFLLKNGSALGAAHYREWAAREWIVDGEKTRLVYSRDGSKVAVKSPGRGTTVFDPATGRRLAHFPKDD